MNFKISLELGSKAMPAREKERKMEIKKFEYLKNETNFLDEINVNNIFHIF